MIWRCAALLALVDIYFPERKQKEWFYSFSFGINKCCCCCLRGFLVPDTIQNSKSGRLSMLLEDALPWFSVPKHDLNNKKKGPQIPWNKLHQHHKLPMKVPKCCQNQWETTWLELEVFVFVSGRFSNPPWKPEDSWACIQDSMLAF